MNVEVVDEAQTRALRRAVLRPHLAPDAPLPGDELTDGVHLAALDETGTVVGTCFVYPEPCPWLPERAGAWRLRQMATGDGLRGRGIGSAVLEAAQAYVVDHGGALLWCDARAAAVAFYRRNGLVGHGEVFTDEQHPTPHLRMWRDLIRQREPQRRTISSEQL
jgi:GNAT superfamily N-acetyltransferase